MERSNKRLILILLLVSIFLLTGCDKFNFNIFNASKDEPGVTVTIEPDNAVSKDGVTKDHPTDSAKSVQGDLTPTTIADIELTIYSISEQGELEPVTALVTEDSTIVPELIVEKVVESLADQSITIGIDSVTSEDDKVIVSFKKDQAPYTNMGSEYEANILNAFAQSLIDNITSVKQVIFRVEGKAYSGGSFEYKLNQSYMSE
jgi:hypothetical protein